MTEINAFLTRELGPWTLGQIGLAFLFLAAAFIVRQIVLGIVGRRLQALAARTETEADDLALKAVVGPVGTLVMLFGIYLAFRVLAREFEEILVSSATIFKVLLTVIVAFGCGCVDDLRAQCLQLI